MEEKVKVALESYIRLKQSLGRTPSSTEFYKGFSKRALHEAFEGGTVYSRLQKLAGDEPKPFSRQKSDLQEILAKWGGLARKTLAQYSKLPIQSDWKINGLTPSVSGIEKSHGIKWSELPMMFRSKFLEDDKWQDVIIAIAPSQHAGVETKLSNEECFVYLMKDLRNNRFKIGISNKPGLRERTLQSEQPKTQLVASKTFVNRKIASAIEKALHETYSHKRVRGEWFLLDAEDISEVRETLKE